MDVHMRIGRASCKKRDRDSHISTGAPGLPIPAYPDRLASNVTASGERRR